MTHGSLFSGIGGFDLAAEWMGWENKFHCEWNPFGQRVLNYYWPNATSYHDITKADFTIWRNRIDVLTGGFPCQPYSMAGKRLGKEDDRHLWPEMLRAIREIAPRWVVGENVLGLVNWNGGMVFNEVQADLETEGYEVQPYVLPACGVGAPHRRDRVWFVAHTKGYGDRGGLPRMESPDGCQWQSQEYGENHLQPGYNGPFGDAPHPNSPGLQKRIQPGIRGFSETAGTFERGKLARAFATTDWEKFPTQPPVCAGDDGLPTELDGITFPKWRNESIKAAGNAIVPQVAYEIFKAIENYDTL
ncbi:DNA cytosine methyltransferase [Pontibacter beigongshangensis]|uniref:DNA cytosine methyltransferase n=1 Tax=Pontibacter beigongshangensis TaxID=2574733 RepID=UPI00164F0D64|nr:DNA cytosine methyltransferase [Pontibacter beigongshangensis]